MLAMQYTIELPQNFPASRIHARVSERSRLFDSLPGLVHKSFLFNEEDNIYAPFYIWENDNVAKEFLLDDLFKGVISSFSRPRVRSWNVISASYSSSKDFAPTFAIREADIIPVEESLQKIAAAEKAKQEAMLAKNNGLYFHAVALDAERWEIIRFSLWRDKSAATKPDADCVQSYDVLHVNDKN